MWSLIVACVSDSSSLKVLTGVKQPAVSAGSSDLPSVAQRPLSAISATVATTGESSVPARHSMLSAISTAVTSASVGTVPMTSGIIATTSASLPTGVGSLQTSVQQR